MICAHVVYGHLRAESPDEIGIAARWKDIERYLHEQDFRLKTVFTDRHVPDDQVQRAGFQSLFDALRTPGVSVVVVPNSRHLSGADLVLDPLRLLIEHTDFEALCIEVESGVGCPGLPCRAHLPHVALLIWREGWP